MTDVYGAIVEHLSERWGLDAGETVYLKTFGKDDLLRTLGISLGLEELFGGGIEAERHWLRHPHSDIAGPHALAVLLSVPGGIGEVAELVERIRGLR